MGWFGSGKGGAHELRSNAAPDDTTLGMPPPPPWAATAEPADGKPPWFKRSYRRVTGAFSGWVGKSILIAVLVLCVFVAVVAVYDRTQSNRLLPGTTVDGVDVGTMTTDEALDLLSERLDGARTREITLTADEVTTTSTLGDLGLAADMHSAVDAAHRGTPSEGIVASTTGVFTRTWHRVLGKPVGTDIEVAYTLDPELTRAHVEGLAGQVHVDARDAEISTSGGEFKVVPEEKGRRIDVDATVAQVTDNTAAWAAAPGPITEAVPVNVVEPAVAKATIGTTLFVNRSKRRVFVYQNGDELATSFPVAIGTPQYPTPRGTFRVTRHRPMPTWVNPDPTGWGASLPKSIPPGPSSPLGRYAINISAPAIRFHEGPAVGTAASHGCMRMYYADVKKLAEYAPVDTRVIIV